MAIKLTWYGHACFSIQTDGTTLLIDPFITGNPLAPIKADKVQADYILVSHGHGDHLGDTVAIAKRTGATVISNYEIQTWLANQGVENTIAQHGSALPDGSYGGNPCGFLLYLQDKRIYHACDTGLFYDMKLIGEEGIDLAILPIGDNFTMGPEDALRAVKLIQPLQVVPIHYDTFDVIKQDPKAWASRVAQETSAKVTVMKPGDQLEL
jgi:L-ascorbate metabolism protein UlaG (beta-lactamase superfamily)